MRAKTRWIDIHRSPLAPSAGKTLDAQPNEFFNGIGQTRPYGETKDRSASSPKADLYHWHRFSKDVLAGHNAIGHLLRVNLTCTKWEAGLTSDSVMCRDDTFCSSNDRRVEHSER